jgi:hypothetical protein
MTALNAWGPLASAIGFDVPEPMQVSRLSPGTAKQA